MLIHPVAQLFPMLPESELKQLADDIKANGLQQPVIMQDETLLDGRNRIAACRLAGVHPTFKQHKGDPVAFIISANIHRRHLSESQRAMVAAKLANMRQGERTDIKPYCQSNKVSQKQAADLLSVNPATVSSAKRISSESPELAKQIENGTLTIGAAKRELKREKYQARVKSHKPTPITTNEPVLPDVILADPPWQYDFSETGNREIENQYDTQSVGTICGHKPDTQKSAILFLWATAPKLHEALTVLSAWGFEYKTHAVWDKKKIGMGYWFRGRHELLLVGTKGSPRIPQDADRVSSIFEEPRGAHSKKPECVYEWIEKAFPVESKLEMYCRKARKGWSVWGNEA